MMRFFLILFTSLFVSSFLYSNEVPAKGSLKWMELKAGWRDHSDFRKELKTGGYRINRPNKDDIKIIFDQYCKFAPKVWHELSWARLNSIVYNLATNPYTKAKDERVVKILMKRCNSPTLVQAVVFNILSEYLGDEKVAPLVQERFKLIVKADTENQNFIYSDREWFFYYIHLPKTGENDKLMKKLLNSSNPTLRKEAGNYFQVKEVAKQN